jgi:hypothetical protein
MTIAQSFIIMITAIIQFGYRDYRMVAWLLIGPAVLSLIYTAIFVPESPQWQEEQGSKEDFEEARETLTYVAKFNGVEKVNDRPYESFRFYGEYKKFDEVEEGATVLDAPSNDSEQTKKSESDEMEENKRYAA